MTPSLFKGASPGLRLFVVYRVVSRLYFHLSILYVFLLVRGHSPALVAVILAAYGFALTASTPFSKIVIARLGAGRALVLGEVLKAVGLLMLAFGARSIPVAVASQFVNAAGFCLGAGADPKILGELVKGNPTTLARVQASTQSLMFLAILVSGVGGGLLFALEPALPLVAGGISAVAASAVAALLARKTSGPALAADQGRSPVVGVLRAERPWVWYYVLTRGFMLGAFVGLLPYLLFRVVQIDVVQLSLCLASFSLAAFVAARFVGTLFIRISARVFAASSAVALIAAFGVFALSEDLWAILMALAVMGLASGGVRPVTMARLAVVASKERDGPIPSALIAHMERSFGICNALVVLGGGLLIAATSFRTAMFAMIVSYVIANAASAAFTAPTAADPDPDPELGVAAS